MRNFIALGYQLADLVKDVFLKEYLEEGQEGSTVVTQTEDQGHEVPVHGEVNTISGEFLGAGCPASQ